MVYSKKHAWMSRLIFGLFFGAAAGQAFQGFAARYFPLIRSAVNVPLYNPPEVNAPGAYALTPVSAVLNNVLFLVIVVSVMTYFFFSFEQKTKPVQAASRFGRYVLMFAFGAIFGSTIMARMSLLIGRVYFLIHDWIQVTILKQTG
jgi:small-conductance mechanosensitive channel